MLDFADYEKVLTDELSTNIILDPDYSNIAAMSLSISANAGEIGSAMDSTHSAAIDSADILPHSNSESYSVALVEFSTEEMPPLYPDYSDIIPEWVLWTGWGALVGITLIMLWADKDKS